ncbi:MAG: hypothetical protein IT581_02060 [Verrucomicrobiales bacterium]|nr:hypothetical protein [Verrucomicrobiales bacterium]
MLSTPQRREDTSRSGVFWVVVGLMAPLMCPPVFASDYARGVAVGQITENSLAEISGIAASRQNPGVFWIHNDRARDQVFAVNAAGKLLSTWTLGGEVSDFEDIAVGPGPRSDFQYVYCGDIGDNAASRSSIRVYRAVEPPIYEYTAKFGLSMEYPVVERFNFTYPDGAHNAETLMVDPWTGDVLVVTKEPGIARFYRAEAGDLADGVKITLSLVAEVDFDIASAGDISPDGREILLRQEEFAKIWRRHPGQTLVEALAGVPEEVPVIGTPIEPNGEGVGLAADGTGYYTISEGKDPTLYFFAKTNGVRAATSERLLGQGAEWRYLDDGSDPGEAWKAPTYDASGWRVGYAQFGYGDGDEQTEISFGGDKDRKRITTFFRAAFEVAGPTKFDALIVRAVYDDGIAVYLNGDELIRTNLAPAATSSDLAMVSASSEENLWHTFVTSNLLVTGTNVIAVEVHRHSRSEADLSFDLQVLGRIARPVLRFVGTPEIRQGGGIELSFEGGVDDEVFLEWSSDVRVWSVVGRVVLDQGKGTYSINATNAAAGFFRLRRSSP